MIYITGDTHGSFDFKKLKTFGKKHSNLTKKDYVIIAGDFGGLWIPEKVEADLEKYSVLPFSTLFIDGNHENFDMLNSFPVTIWNGGKTHVIKSDIIHLMRGQVYNIGGKIFFTFGGATSVDKYARTEGVSWWRQELPTYEELDEGIINLKTVNNKVDFIVTHACDERALYYPPLNQNYKLLKIYPENKMLSCFEDTVEYEHWYFGHYHIDAKITDKKTALYQDIIKLK